MASTGICGKGISKNTVQFSTQTCLPHASCPSTDIEKECSERMEDLVKAMAKQEGVTEALKAADQMAWVRRMNNIRNCAEKIILSEMVLV